MTDRDLHNDICGRLRFHGDRVTGDGLLDFAVNVWPAPLPAPVHAAMLAALDDVARYPDDGPAREALAGRHGRSADEVVVLNGACEAFWLLAPALRPRHVACVHPGFTEGEAALRAAGVHVTRVLREPESWRLDAGAVPEDADLVLLDNPNNPTGVLDPAESVAALVRPGRVVVVDESFVELTEHPEHSLAERGDLTGLVVLRSLTKLWGLAGIRAGYLLTSPDLAGALAGSRQPWSVNALALAAMQTCAADAAIVSTAGRVAADVASARADLLARLRAVPGLRTWPAAANFVLIEAPHNGPRCIEQLRDAGIAVRPAVSFPGLGPDHIRIAVRGPADHERLVTALHSAVQSAQ